MRKAGRPHLCLRRQVPLVLRRDSETRTVGSARPQGRPRSPLSLRAPVQLVSLEEEEEHRLLRILLAHLHLVNPPHLRRSALTQEQEQEGFLDLNQAQALQALVVQPIRAVQPLEGLGNRMHRSQPLALVVSLSSQRYFLYLILDRSSQQRIYSAWYYWSVWIYKHAQHRFWSAAEPAATTSWPVDIPWIWKRQQWNFRLFFRCAETYSNKRLRSVVGNRK